MTCCAGSPIRSNAGLYYRSYPEFRETLSVLETNRDLRRGLGENGRSYFRRHYTWPVIERKYLSMLGRLDDENREGRPDRLEPLPGWWASRRRTVAPAREIVDAAPTGPIRPSRRRRGG